LVDPTNGKIVLHDKLRMQTLWHVSNCLAEWLSQYDQLDWRLS